MLKRIYSTVATALLFSSGFTELSAQTETSRTNLAPPKIQPKQIRASHVVKIYADLTKRTVITHSQAKLYTVLPAFQTTLTTNQQTLAGVRAALAQEGVGLKEVGESFLLVVPVENLARLPEFPALTEKVQPGEKAESPIHFENMPLNQIMSFYADLTGKTFDAEISAKGQMISIDSGRTKLAKSQIIAVIETAIQLHNMKIVEEENNRIVVVPLPGKAK